MASTVVPELPSSVDPTLTALEMHAGKAKAVCSIRRFPEAMTVAIPIERRLSIIGLYIGFAESQFDEYFPPPKLILTAAILKVPARANS